MVGLNTPGPRRTGGGPAIHPTASVHPTAVFGDNARIGAFAVVGEGVEVGNDCDIAEHAIVRAGCRLGHGISIDSFAVLGGQPQMRTRTAACGQVHVGDHTVVREGVTISLPTKADGVTSIGDHCFLMANSHVGHDAVVGNSVTLANNVMLAGHVRVDDSVFLGGGAGVHQFVRIGRGAIVGGNASISYDVAPFVIAAERNRVCGLNVVGLRRLGIAAPALADLKRCYHAVFGGSGDVRDRAARALAAGLGCEPEGRTFLEFFATGRRGFAQARAKSERMDRCD